MATQTALAITGIGQPLEKVTQQIPEPKENELLIKVTATGLAPFDQKLRDYGLYNIGDYLPSVVSLDTAGIVVKNGVNTEKFPVGSHVFSQPLFTFPLQGGLQEYIVIDARFTAIVPKNISDLDAALYPINAFTSALALFSEKGVGIPWPDSPEGKKFDYTSQKLVIIGGGTNTGKLAIMLARIAGIGSIIVTAGLAGAEELKSYGATHIIDRRASDAGEQIRAIVGDDLVYVYDTITRGDLSFAVSLLSNTKEGKLAHLLPGKIDEAVQAQKTAGVVEKQIFGASQATPEFAVPFWEKLPKWIENGEVKLLKYGVIEGLDEAKINAVFDEYRDEKKQSGERLHVRLG